MNKNLNLYFNKIIIIIINKLDLYKLIKLNNLYFNLFYKNNYFELLIIFFKILNILEVNIYNYIYIN